MELGAETQGMNKTQSPAMPPFPKPDDMAAARPSAGPQHPSTTLASGVAIRISTAGSGSDDEMKDDRGAEASGSEGHLSEHLLKVAEGPPPRRASSDTSMMSDTEMGDYGDADGPSPPAAAAAAAQISPPPDPPRLSVKRSRPEELAGDVHPAFDDGTDKDDGRRGGMEDAGASADALEQQRIQARRDRNRKFQAKKRRMHKEIVENLTAEAARYELENAQLGRQIVALERKIDSLRSGVTDSDEGVAAEALIQVGESPMTTPAGSAGTLQAGSVTEANPIASNSQAARVISVARESQRLHERAMADARIAATESRVPGVPGVPGVPAMPTMVQTPAGPAMMPPQFMYPGHPGMAYYQVPAYHYPQGAMMTPAGMMTSQPAMMPAYHPGAMQMAVQGYGPPGSFMVPGGATPAGRWPATTAAAAVAQAAVHSAGSSQSTGASWPTHGIISESSPPPHMKPLASASLSGSNSQ